MRVLIERPDMQMSKLRIAIDMSPSLRWQLHSEVDATFRLLCVLVGMSLLCVCHRYRVSISMVYAYGIRFTLELDRTSSICPVKYADVTVKLK